MSDELFDLPVTLSPRLQWKAKHDFRTHYSKPLGDELAQYPDRDIEPWTAWLPDNDSPCGAKMPNSDQPDRCGYGRTEDDALVACAKIYGLKLWNEEAP